MGILEVGNRASDNLPSIGLFDFEKNRSEISILPTNHSFMTSGLGAPAPPLISPTSMYPRPPAGPTPYSPYPASATNPGTQVSGHISSPISRRSDEDKEPQQQPAPRQSLPSIHEALGNDNPLPYPNSSTNSLPTQSTHHPSHPALPSSLISRSGEGPSGPPNPFSNVPGPSPYLRDSPYHMQPGLPPQSQADVSRSSLTSVNTSDSRKPSLPSLSSGKSPTQSARTAATSVSISQNSAGYEYTTTGSTSALASPNGPSPYPQLYSYQSQPLNGQPPGPPSSYDNRNFAAPWKPAPSEGNRMDDVRRGLNNNRPGLSPLPPNDSVKRHFDGYEVEVSLNEMMDGSTKTLDFSKLYAARAHQTQRSGPVPGSLPSLQEIDDILQLQHRNHEALIKLRTAVVNQEHLLAEQRAQLQPYKSDNPADDEHMGVYQEEFKGGGGFAGADPKKRRGKAAPPGRCHSCNRAETPEWRRGPDGARTLCNACGLHYAKLTRKQGASKTAGLGNNLKPKIGLGSTSPTQR